jgi:hypothetical protein
MIRTVVFTASISGALFLTIIGCTNSASSSYPGSEVAADLRLIAKHCTKLLAPAPSASVGVDEPVKGLARTAAVHDSFSITFNADSTEVDVYAEDWTMRLREHCRYYTIENTPLNVNLIAGLCDSGDTGRYHIDFSMSGDLGGLSFIGEGISTVAVYTGNSSTCVWMSMSTDGNYTYTYEADGFSMELKDYRTVAEVSDARCSSSFRGDLVFLGGKYSAHASGAFDYSVDSYFDPGAEYIRADLLDRSNVKVGVVVLTCDSSVKLYDLDGNLIAAGDANPQ